MVFIHIERNINFYWYTIGRITKDGVIIYERDRLHSERERAEINTLLGIKNVKYLDLHETEGRIVSSVRIDGKLYDVINPSFTFSYTR